MNVVHLSWLQTRFEIKNFLRNRSAMLFSVAFPILLLVVLGSVNSGNMEFRGQQVDGLSFFVPGIMAFGIVGTCYTSLAIRLVLLRDNGVLKRVAGTPLPRVSYIAGHIGSSVVLALVLAAVTYLTGWVLYDVTIDPKNIPAFVLSLIVGSATLCAVGLAVASVIPNGDGAPGIVNFLLFPVLFVSDIFYPVGNVAPVLSWIGSVFPLKHLANAMQTAFNPVGNGWGFSWINIAVMLAWCLAATFIAVRFFRWETTQHS